MPDTSAAALPYHEPGIVTILILSSFILLLNTVNYALDRVIYCGLIGQIFIGVGWGLPGTNWLTSEMQDVVMQLGYLGLILIVFEGGLSTDMKTLKANLGLSSTVALIGIGTPIGISFVLMAMLPVTPVQAFAAGAALCSTSLGTTFTVLATSGLTESRLGVVLTSAAMMDDVVGLVMVQVISNLGSGPGSFDPVTVVRPVMVSIAFAVIVPLMCAYIVRPTAKRMHGWMRSTKRQDVVATLLSQPASFVFSTGVLLAMVTGTTYAGTSNLFAAYLSGASITWLDSYLKDLDTPAQGHDMELTTVDGTTAHITERSASICTSVDDNTQTPTGQKSHASGTTGLAVYESYYQPAVNLILRPFFFASIGFSIPITQMFSGGIVWRGIVYAILMTFAKLICGAPLIGVEGVPTPRAAISKLWPRIELELNKKKKTKKFGPQNEPVRTPDPRTGTEPAVPTNAVPTEQHETANTSRKRTRPATLKPKSLYPAAMLGSAMVARGEIGFLISSVAESNGVFGSSSDGGSSDIFLVVTWAVLVCTVLGPVTVGLMVRRVKKLQRGERKTGNGKRDPLGSWGVVPS